MEHSIKIQKQYFNKVLSKEKTFELRKNDRNYKIGDTLILKEIDDHDLNTGHSVTVEITYILNGPCYGLEAGFCIMSVKRSLKKQNLIHLINRMIKNLFRKNFIKNDFN